MSKILPCEDKKIVWKRIENIHQTPLNYQTAVTHSKLFVAVLYSTVLLYVD